MLLATLVTVLWLAVLPAAASAHGVISIGSGTLSYRSEDTGAASRLEVRASVAAIRIYDPGTFGGMQAPAQCRPGRTDPSGNPVEFTCPATGLSDLGIDVEGAEDVVDSTGPFRQRIDGGFGADRIRAGDAAANVSGGEGNDVLETGAADDTVDAGPGSDTLATGGGADLLTTADGERDQVRCGDGADQVNADTVDVVDPDCELVQRSFVAPPQTSTEGDGTAPVLRVRTRSTQRLSRGRPFVTATANETGSVSASAYLELSGVTTRIAATTRKVTRDKALRLSFRLSAAQLKRVRRAVDRGRRARLVVRIDATDAAGNSSRVKTVRVRLRR